MELEQIAEKLKKEKSAAIFCHIRPDGDCLGSALALSSALAGTGVRTEVFCESPVPEKFYFLSGAREVRTSFSGSFSAHVAVDCSDPPRMGALADAFASSANTYCVDHHVSNTRYARFCCVQDRAATALMVCDLFRLWGIAPNREQATALLTGISTDTGHFMHSNVGADALEAARMLTEAGADLHDVAYRMFKSQPKERLALLARTLSGIRYFEEGKIALEYVPLAALAETGATPDMTEGFIDSALSVEGVEVAVCILQVREKNFKVSFRSKGKADVNAVAARFGGGGHVLASGCMINGFYEDVADKLVFAVRNYLE